MNRMERLRMRAVERMRPRRGGGDMSIADQARFREDAGWKMTDAQYQAFLENESKFNEGYGTAMEGFKERWGSLEGVRKKLEGAEGALAKGYQQVAASSPENIWNQYRQTWVPVTVTSGDVKEGAYFLPGDVINKLATETFNQGEGSFAMAQGEDGQWYVDTLPIGTSDRYGKELHEALGGVEGEIKQKFFHGWTEEEPSHSEAYDEWEKRYKKAVKEGRVDPEDEFGTLPEDLMDNPYKIEDWQGTHYTGQAQKIREKQAAARKILDAQSDIVKKGRSQYQGALDAYNLEKGEYESIAKGRADEKKRLSEDFEARRQKRRQLFALEGK